MAMPVAEPGITKAADLAWIDLPPGMGGGAPIWGSKHGYVGTLLAAVQNYTQVAIENVTPAF